MSNCEYLDNKKLWLDEVAVKGTFLKGHGNEAYIFSGFFAEIGSS
jgi:hypothetical protein